MYYLSLKNKSNWNLKLLHIHASEVIVTKTNLWADNWLLKSLCISWISFAIAFGFPVRYLQSCSYHHMRLMQSSEPLGPADNREFLPHTPILGMCLLPVKAKHLNRKWTIIQLLFCLKNRVSIHSDLPRTSFLPLDWFGTLVQKCVNPFLSPLLYTIDLYVCSYANSIL